jgi:hypothetical protein
VKKNKIIFFGIIFLSSSLVIYPGRRGGGGRRGRGQVARRSLDVASNVDRQGRTYGTQPDSPLGWEQRIGVWAESTDNAEAYYARVLKDPSRKRVQNAIANLEKEVVDLGNTLKNSAQEFTSERREQLCEYLGRYEKVLKGLRYRSRVCRIMEEKEKPPTIPCALAETTEFSNEGAIITWWMNCITEVNFVLFYIEECKLYETSRKYFSGELVSLRKFVRELSSFIIQTRSFINVSELQTNLKELNRREKYFSTKDRGWVRSSRNRFSLLAPSDSEDE